MTCRYCENPNNKLVKAHVIPEGFFRRMDDAGGTLRLLSENQEQYPKRSPIGVYDSTILCQSCEPLFGDWDNYAQELLTEEPKDSVQILANGLLVGYEVKEYRYDLLKLFFISVLWRASVSTHAFYEKIRLGPYEAEARDFLRRRDPGNTEDFAVTLAKFDDPLGKAILDPHPEKWEGINYYRFYLGGYVAYVKTDQQPAPEPLSEFAMTPGKALRIIRRNLDRSDEKRLLYDIATAPKNQPLRQSDRKW